MNHKLPILDALEAGFEGTSTKFLFGDNPPERPQKVLEAMEKAEKAKQTTVEVADQKEATESKDDDPYKHLDKVLLDKLIPIAKKQGLSRVQLGSDIYPVTDLQEARKAQIEQAKCEKKKRKAESEAKQREREEQKSIPYKERLKALKERIVETAKKKVEKFTKKYEHKTNVAQAT